MMDHAVRTIFDAQHGIITRQQAIEAGLTRAQIRHRITTGAWIRVHYGLYRHAMMPGSWRGQLMLGVLATGGVASHRSAARLHRFERWGRSASPEVVVDHGRWRAVQGVVVHQTTQIDRLDHTIVDGLRCTGPGRTVLDLGVSMRPGDLGKVVDDLLLKGRVTQAQLWDVLLRHSVQGRTGCGPLRLVLELRLGEKRVALSDWSYAVANLLESAGLARPELEFRAHDESGRFLGQIDLAYPEAMLAIELDSVAFHHNLESFGRDRGRARGLTVNGWSVLQFTWEDYTQRPDQLIAQVSGILRRVGVTT